VNKNKIILSHSPGTGGNHIAAMIGNKKGKLNSNTGIWESSLSGIKNIELELHLKKYSHKKWLEYIKKMFSNGETVICTHQTNIKFPNDFILVRTYWNKSSLTKYFCYRDLNTTNLKNILPIFYNKQNPILKLCQNQKIPENFRFKKFLKNHLHYAKIIHKKPNLGSRWKYFCIDNILNLNLFVQDLEIFCDNLNLSFNKTKIYDMHRKWLKKNKRDNYNDKLTFINLKKTNLFMAKENV
jgi:hypothetical protein